MTHKQIDLFADNLRAIRTSEGFALRPLAKRAGVSFNAISEIENRKTEPSLLTALRIAKALGCSLEHMLQDHPAEATSPAATEVKRLSRAHAAAMSQADYWQERCLSAEATRDRLQAALDAMQTIEKLDHLLREGAKVIRVVVESSQHSLEEVIGRDWVIVEAFRDGAEKNACYVRLEPVSRRSIHESRCAYGETFAEAARNAIDYDPNDKFEMTGGS